MDQGGGADIAQGPGSAGDGSVDILRVVKIGGYQDIADPLAGYGEGLAVGITDQGVPVELGDEGGFPALIDQFPVGLVRDQVEGMAQSLGLAVQEPAQGL